MPAGGRADGRCTVLLVEDSEAVAELIHLWLDEPDETDSLKVVRATRLATGLERLAVGDVDVVLLDLSLPDSHGVDTVRAVVGHSPELPIVVLTGNRDPGMAIDAVRAGAEDYLPKSQMSQDYLHRVLVQAIERRQRRRGSEPGRPTAWLHQELERLDSLDHGAWHARSEAGSGASSVQEQVPEVFAALVTRYGELLELTTAGDFDADEQARTLHEIANALGEHWGGPGDAMALHAAALRARVGSATLEQFAAAPEKGRLVLLQLIGHLTATYRSWAWTARHPRRRRATGTFRVRS